MTEWLLRYAQALENQLEGLSIELADDEKGSLLDLARVVAHGTERKNAPLATFIAGRFAQAVVNQGGSPADAIATAVSVAEEMIGSSADPQPG
jgi:hypothetical protein